MVDLLRRLYCYENWILDHNGSLVPWPIIRSLDVAHSSKMVIGIKGLGDPEYFLTIGGTAKLLAILGLLMPGFQTLREWTYAGLTFLTIGAAWSHLANNQSPLPPIVFLVLALASYTSSWSKTFKQRPKQTSRVR